MIFHVLKTEYGDIGPPGKFYNYDNPFSLRSVFFEVFMLKHVINLITGLMGPPGT